MINNNPHFVISLIPGLTSSRPGGHLRSGRDGKDFALDKVLYLEHWSDLAWRAVATAEKLVYGFLLLFPMHFASYVAYEAAFLWLSRRIKDRFKRVSVLLRVSYIIIVFIRLSL